MVTEITKLEELNELTKNKFLLVDCYTTWCGPCKLLSPVLDELSNELTDIYFAKCDIEKESTMVIANMYRIEAVPTLLFFKEGKIFKILTGYRDYDKMKEILQTLIK